MGNAASFTVPFVERFVLPRLLESGAKTLKKDAMMRTD